MKQKNPSRKRSIYLAVFFLGGLILLVSIAIIIRIVILFSHSVYDGRSMYILEVTTKNKQTMLAIFSPDIEKISLIKIIGNTEKNNIQKSLAVPVDAMIRNDAVSENDDLPSILWNSFIRFQSIQSHAINEADIYKLFLLSRSIKSSSFTIQSVHIPLQGETESNIISQSFNDHIIFDEGESIVVVNATGNTGLANKLTRLLTNMGGNVISIDTAENAEAHSVIEYTGYETYTIRRIKKILHFQTRNQKPPLSDIMIRIGRDNANPSMY